ncbi:MAG TPA: NfeD family protein [Pseudothermotoga sp.]|nr:NfeD family protein [Pseudothermotoga sp.]HOK83552.1 NfeD family protein [Pseudothermotoga sp.]HPP69625.1 NfeD family protein [Pseudothermotoga sp.]
MEPFVVWLIFGVIFVIGEIFTPTFFLFWFGIGAFVASAVSVAFGTLIQVITFIVVSGLLVILTRPLTKKLTKEQPRKIHVDEIIGKIGSVVETVNNEQGKGLVKIDGDIWRAYSKDDSIIQEGEKVKILRVEGAHVVVEKSQGGEEK